MYLYLSVMLGCSDLQTPSTSIPIQGQAPPPDTSVGFEVKKKPTQSVKKKSVNQSSSDLIWHPDGFESHPLYFSRALKSTDLEKRTLRELSLMRNIIFARIGNAFVKPWLDDYFGQYGWYKPKKYLQFEHLASYDRDNAALIAKHESQIQTADLLSMREALYEKKANRRMRPIDERELHLIAARLGEWSGDESMPIQRRNPLEDPNTLQYQLKRVQVEKMSLRDLRLLRNTIFARYGRSFKSEILNHHFMSMTWYKINQKYDDGMLTKVDKRNIQLIQSMENKLGGALSDDDHAHEIGWYGGA